MSLSLLLQERKEMLGAKFKDSVTVCLKEGTFKKDAAGVFSSKVQTVLLLPQFLVYVDGKDEKAVISDAVVLRDAQVRPQVTKNLSGSEFVLEVMTSYHGTKKQPSPPGLFKLICASLEERAQWLTDITEAIQHLTVYSSIAKFSFFCF
jgi:hypothetical protein